MMMTTMKTTMKTMEKSSRGSQTTSMRKCLRIPSARGISTWPEFRLQQVGVRSDGGQAVVE